MRRALSALLLILFVHAMSGIATPAGARENLNGNYAFTSFRSCTVANNPFLVDPSGAPTLIPVGGVFRQNSVDVGTLAFKSDGTGTNFGRSITMNTTVNGPVGVSILSVSDFTAPFTYTVNDDRTIDVNFGVVTFTIVLGASTGNMGTASPRLAHLQIGNGGQELVGAPAGVPVVEQETVTIFAPNGPTSTTYRLCLRSGPNVRM